MSENSELEDLEQLVSLPGWARFAEMVDKQWGAAGLRYTEAVSGAARIEADANAMNILRQVIIAQREIQNVLGMVGHRIKTLKQHAKEPALVGQSRRGSL